MSDVDWIAFFAAVVIVLLAALFWPSKSVDAQREAEKQREAKRLAKAMADEQEKRNQNKGG